VIDGGRPVDHHGAFDGPFVAVEFRCQVVLDLSVSSDTDTNGSGERGDEKSTELFLVE
jgi:hypothetical protein